MGNVFNIKGSSQSSNPTVANPVVANPSFANLKEEDVAVGEREIGYQAPKQSGFEDENAEIKPSYSYMHWAIKFGPHYYHLNDKKAGKLVIKMIVSLKEKKSFKWEVKGTISMTGSDIIRLIEEINEKKLSYKIISRNCQHFASAIGNYAMSVWDKKKALEYFVG